MKQVQYKRAVIVGTFVLLGIIIFIATVLTLGGQKKTFEKTFTLKAIFTDVNGLQVGNNVWFSGVKIGTIKKVDLSSNDEVEVVMYIEKRSQKFIHRDVKAKIGSDGLIGNRIVILYGGSKKTPIVESGNMVAVDKSQSTEDMMNTLQANNQNLLTITNNFKAISEQMAAGRGTVGKLLMDESLVKQLEATASNLRATSLQARTLTSNVAQYASRLDTKGSLTNEVVSDTTVFNALKATMAQIKEVSKTAASVIENLEKASAQLNENKGTAGVLLNDPETAAYVKTTLKNLQNGTEKLDANMEALQHSFLLRGYFKRKAKNMDKQQNSVGSIGSANQ